MPFLANDNALADRAPLADMKLEDLGCAGTRVTDLAPLRGMPLKSFHLKGTRSVKDLGPLQTCPLEFLDIEGTDVADLTPLRQSKLRLLFISPAVAQANRQVLPDMRPLKRSMSSRPRSSGRNWTRSYPRSDRAPSMDAKGVADDRRVYPGGVENGENFGARFGALFTLAR